jgi:hypothetical protein
MLPRQAFSRKAKLISQNKKDKYGNTMAQLLEYVRLLVYGILLTCRNIAMGQDAKMGEWERPDNIA